MAAGQPTKYKEEYNKIAAKMCELGATDMDLADAFSADVRTIYRWKVKHTEFCQSLRLGKDVPDNRVERALYERAIGYSHDDVDIRVIDGVVVQTSIIKHYPPDTKAALAWLYNRRSDNWHPLPTASGEDNSLAEAFKKLADKLPD